jgi:VanZ family protein
MLKRITLYWLPVLAWATLIFYVSSQPSLPQLQNPWWELLLKKGGHLVEFAVLAWLLMRALQNPARVGGRAYLWSLSTVILYAASDEFHQWFVPGRHPSPIDLTIDAAGAGLALLAYWLVSRRRQPP